MRAVRDDGIGVAVQRAQQDRPGDVRGAARMRPQSAPEQERDSGPPRAGPGGGESDAARGAADDGPVVPGRGQPHDVGLLHLPRGDAVIEHRAGRVVGAPAEQRELDPGPRVQRLERPDAVGRHQVGDEQDRPATQSSASS